MSGNNLLSREQEAENRVGNGDESWAKSGRDIKARRKMKFSSEMKPILEVEELWETVESNLDKKVKPLVNAFKNGKHRTKEELKAADTLFDLIQETVDYWHKNREKLTLDLEKLNSSDIGLYVAVNDQGGLKVGMSLFNIQNRVRHQWETGRISAAWMLLSFNGCKQLIPTEIIDEILGLHLPYLFFHQDKQAEARKLVTIHLAEIVMGCLIKNNNSSPYGELFVMIESPAVLKSLSPTLNELGLQRALVVLKPLRDKGGDKVKPILRWSTFVQDTRNLNSRLVKRIFQDQPRPRCLFLKLIMFGEIFGEDTLLPFVVCLPFHPRTIELEDNAMDIKRLLEEKSPNYGQEIINIIKSFDNDSENADDFYHPEAKDIGLGAEGIFKELFEKKETSTIYLIEHSTLEDLKLVLGDYKYKTFMDIKEEINILDDGGSKLYILVCKSGYVFVVCSSLYLMYAEKATLDVRLTSAKTSVALIRFLKHLKWISETHSDTLLRRYRAGTMGIVGFANNNEEDDMLESQFRIARQRQTPANFGLGAPKNVLAIAKRLKIGAYELVQLMHHLETTERRNGLLSLYGISPNNPLTNPDFQCPGVPANIVSNNNNNNNLECQPQPQPQPQPCQPSSCCCCKSSGNLPRSDEKRPSYLLNGEFHPDIPFSGQFFCQQCLRNVQRRVADHFVAWQKATGGHLSSSQLAFVTKVQDMRAKHALEQQKYRQQNYDKVVRNERIRNVVYNERRHQDRVAHQLRLAKQRLKRHAALETGDAESAIAAFKDTGTNRHSARVEFSDPTMAKLKQVTELFAMTSGEPKFNIQKNTELYDLIQIMEYLEGNHDLKRKSNGILLYHEGQYQQVRSEFYVDPENVVDSVSRVGVGKSRATKRLELKPEYKQMRQARGTNREGAFRGMQEKDPNFHAPEWNGKRQHWAPSLRRLQYHLSLVEQVYANVSDLPYKRKQLRRIYFDCWYAYQQNKKKKDDDATLQGKIQEMLCILGLLEEEVGEEDEDETRPPNETVPPSTESAAAVVAAVAAGKGRAKRPTGKENWGPSLSLTRTQSRNASMKQAPPLKQSMLKLPPSKSMVRKQAPLKPAPATAAATATTATTKVKRPSFSGKKATAKAAKQSSSSSSISKAALGKENKLPAKPQSKSSEYDMIDLCKDETDSGGVVEIMDSSDDDA